MGRNTSTQSKSPVRVSSSFRRERDKDRERERDRDKDREREGRREKDRERVRERTRDRDRDRDRDKGRETNRDKDKDIHRNVSRESERSPVDRRHTSSRTQNVAASSGKDGTNSSPQSDEKVRRLDSRSRSPSPRTKRLRRGQADKENERGNERNHGSGRGGEKEKESVKGFDKGTGNEKRNEKRSSQRDADVSDYSDDAGYRNRPSRPRNEKSNVSPDRHHKSKSMRRSSSPEHHRANSKGRDEMKYEREADHRNGEDDSVSKMKAAAEALEAKDKVKPSFELSGKLAAETNRVRGVTLLFNEPPDARKPDIRWRLYVFKAGEVLNEPLYIHRQSCYLFGREKRVADIPTDHPSCSKQHAVIQFRQVEKEQPDGMVSKQIRPYLMDLGSTNKTFINDEPIEPQRYYELREKDTIRFGNSSREYVLLHENSNS